jgi:hypothetical protein
MIINLNVWTNLHRSTILANFVAPYVPSFDDETFVVICHSIASDQCRSEV